MQEGRASRTAERVAVHRAVHQLYDDLPLVFTDPLALQVLTAGSRAEVYERGRVERIDPFARGMRAFVCARARFAEDALEQATARGVCQYVVLGAGLDTFIGRTRRDGLRIFEVDHPATQIWKQGLLKGASLHVPDTVTFVSVDFEREDLMRQLVRHGFDAAAPAFCSWLGVLPYLTHEAAEGTFRALGALPAGSGVAFDYGMARNALSEAQQAARDRLSERVARVGEPFRSGFEPNELRGLLHACGFTRVEDLDSPAVAARYFADRTDGLTVRGVGHIACAWRD